MMHIDMKKAMTYLFAIGAAMVCLVMIFLGVINQDIPALVWLAFSAFMFAFVVAENSQKEAYKR